MKGPLLSGTNKMPKKKIQRLNKPYYVFNDWGHTDAILVRKINELIRVVNDQQEIIEKLKGGKSNENKRRN